MVFRSGSTSRPGRQLWRQGWRFALVGASGYGVNLVVFAVLLHVLGAPAVLAAAGAWGVAWCNNFAWNRQWTFAAGGRVGPQALRFAVVSAGVAGMALGLLLALGALGLVGVPAQALAVLMVAPLSFVLQRGWSFGLAWQE